MRVLPFGLAAMHLSMLGRTSPQRLTCPVLSGPYTSSSEAKRMLTEDASSNDMAWLHQLAQKRSQEVLVPRTAHE